MHFTQTGSSTVDRYGTGTYQGSDQLSSTVWDFNWDLTANADPFISGNLTFTNTTTADQTFNVVLLLPTASTSGTVNETGSLGINFSDANGDGSAALAMNQWHGLINPPATILDMPLLIGSSFNCTGPGCIFNLSPTTAKQTHSEVDHNGNPITSIGTHLNFTLSAGDRVTLNTNFDVAPVPVPAALWLFLSGLAGFGVTGRMRRAE